MNAALPGTLTVARPAPVGRAVPPPRKVPTVTAPPTIVPSVAGGDISLTASGIAHSAGTVVTHGRDGISTIADIGLRTEAMGRLIIELAYHFVGDGKPPALVALEDLTQRGGAAGISTEKAHVWWSLVRALHGYRVPVIAVPVKTAKLYACGMGDANKREVIAAVRRDLPGWEIRRSLKSGKLSAKDDDNKADAVTLMAIASHLLGHPMVEVTPFRLRALEALTLPEGLR